MHLNTDGWLNCAERCASPHYNARPDADDISLLVIHNISLPPQEYGDRYISALFLGTLPARRHEHPYLDEIADLRVSSCAMATSNNMCPPPPAPGMRAPPFTQGGKTATISALASN